MAGDRIREISGWADLVRSIGQGDEQSAEELYQALANWVRANLRRSVAPEAIEDAVQEVLVVVLEAVRNGDLRDPARLMGFVKCVAHRQAVAQIRSAIFRRRRFASTLEEPRASQDHSPEMLLTQSERLVRAKKILRVLNGRDREILERFYLHEQPREQICGEMNLTDTQFRLFKSRAIARCTTLASANPPARSESRIA